MEPQEHEALLRTLAGIAAQQVAIHADLRELLRQQAGTSPERRERNRQQVVSNATMDATLARMRTLLARILPHGQAGTDA